MSEASHKERIQAQFGGSAERYVTSTTHASGDDLAQLADWAEGGPGRDALDVATGGGHTALALSPHYRRIVASDLTDPMLASAERFIRSQGVTNVEFERADAEDLPFPNAAFDTISCRIAPHHFARIERFVQEVARVLKTGGIFLLEDSVVPEEPALADWLNHAEALRDSTHVRSLKRSEWLTLLKGAGLQLEAERIFPKPHPFASWLDRSRTPEAAADATTAFFLDAPAAARTAFEIAIAPDGTVESYTDEKIVLKARKGRSS